jgi:hypothetical protein
MVPWAEGRIGSYKAKTLFYPRIPTPVMVTQMTVEQEDDGAPWLAMTKRSVREGRGRHTGDNGGVQDFKVWVTTEEATVRPVLIRKTRTVLIRMSSTMNYPSTTRP